MTDPVRYEASEVLSIFHDMSVLQLHRFAELGVSPAVDAQRGHGHQRQYTDIDIFVIALVEALRAMGAKLDDARALGAAVRQKIGPKLPTAAPLFLVYSRGRPRRFVQTLKQLNREVEAGAITTTINLRRLAGAIRTDLAVLDANRVVH